METLQDRLQREAREKFEATPVSLRIDALESYAHVHGWSQFEGRTIQDEIDTLISHTISETIKEAVRVIEGEKGKWVASYMPATDGKDPSKWGFDTKQEAWEWIEKQLTPCPLDPEDTSGKPCDSCMAEWIVYQIGEVDQALSSAITAVEELAPTKTEDRWVGRMGQRSRE